MIDIHGCIEKYHLTIHQIKKVSNYIILYGDKENYLLKEKDSSKKELFAYFESIQYPYYVPLLNDDQDPYELYPYYDDRSEDVHLKGKMIIDALSYLHTQSVYEEGNENILSDLYEHLKKQIQDVQKYYENLQDYIEQFSFPRVDYYFLITHISLFYQSLFKAHAFLEEWYQKKPFKIRKAMVLHNASIDHFRVHDGGYFIDYGNCFQDLVVYDFVHFYKEDVLKVEMSSLYERYCSQFPLLEEEKKLLFCLLCIPTKISFSSNNIYGHTVAVQRELEIINHTFYFLLEEDKKDQETNEEEFKEQDNNIDFSRDKDQN